MDALDWAMVFATALTGASAAAITFFSGPVWDLIAGKQVADLSPRLKDLELGDAYLYLMLRIWGLSILGAFIGVGIILQAFPIALLTIAVIYVSPRYWLEYMIWRRKTLLRDQMVAASMALANAVRAGLSLAQGFETITAELSEPLASEFRKLVRQYQLGHPLPRGLTEMKERLKIDSFNLFVSTLLVNLERGGNVTDILERIAYSLQENQRLERKLEAETETSRKMAIVLALFPFFFLFILQVMDPQSVVFLFTTLLGQLLMVAVFGLVVISARWSYHIMDIDV